MKLNIEGYKPYNFQNKTITDAMAAVRKYGGCCIFDETGLGKTITGAHIALNLGGDRILIVSPKANQSAWKRILPNAVVCTKQKITVESFDTVIVDEAHNFNNIKNKSFRALLDVIYFQGDFPNVILLTATPVNNNVGELFTMFKLIPFRPHTSPFYTVPVAGVQAMAAEKELKTYERFNVDPVTGLGHSMRQITKHVDLKYAYKDSLEVFGGVMKEFCFRNTRKSITENYVSDMDLMGHFPKIFKQNIAVQFRGNEIYKTIEAIEKMPFAYYNILQYVENPVQVGLGGIMKTLLLKRLDSSVCAFKETIGKMRSTFQSVTSGVVQIDGVDYIVSDKFFIDLALDLDLLDGVMGMWQGVDDSQKLALLLEQIKLADGKVVVFTEYTATQAVIVEYLKQYYSVLSYNGQTDEKVLEVIQNEFDRNLDVNTNKYLVLVATDALAEGVNLHLSSTLIHYDLKWNPSRLIQREGRVNRLVKNGITPKDINVMTFGVELLVEAVVRLEKRLATKTDMADLILNSSYKLDYIKNANHSEYCLDGEQMNFHSYWGVKVDGGTLFFLVSDYNNRKNYICSLRDLPTVKIKKNGKVDGGYSIYPRGLFWGNGLSMGYNEKVRIAACYGGWADRVMLKWQEREIGITDKADLTEWPNGMYDQQLKQFAEIVKWKRKKSTTYKLITN